MGRSLFRIFLRLREGREATQEYHRKLLEFPQPRIVHPNSRARRFIPNPELPQFPKGTEVALVRQMMLFDDEGNVTPTEITESVQIRSFVTVDDPSGREDPLVFEWKLSRPALFGGENGGLRPLGPDEKAFSLPPGRRTIGIDAFEHQGEEWRDRRGRPLQSCRRCHAASPRGGGFNLQGPGIHSFISLDRILPNSPTDISDAGSAPRPRPGAEAVEAQVFKERSYTWELLQGLWAEEP